MAGTLALALGVPAALGAAWLASRRSWSPAVADIRGIALQTVIIIVVMLVIAGGVSAVLLTRGTDVVSDLESQDIAINVSEDNCTAQVLGGHVGAVSSNDCVFTGAGFGRQACATLQGLDGARGRPSATIGTSSSTCSVKVK